MIPHCSPDAMREHLAAIRANPGMQIHCPNCPAEYARNASGRLLRRTGPHLSWTVVNLGEASTTPRVDCPPRMRGAIKGLQQRAGLNDADYRRLLQDVAGVRSSTELDAEKAALVVRAIEDRIAANAGGEIAS